MEVHHVERRAVEGDAGGHRRRDDDRRPAKRVLPYVRRRGLLLHLRRRRLRRRHRRAGRLPPRRRDAGHGDRGAAAGPLRRARDRRRPRRAASRRSRAATAPGSTAASSCCRPRSATTSTATTTIWEQEPLERLAARRPARRLPPRRASGRRWTRCATRTTLEELWAAGGRHGRAGSRVSWWAGRPVFFTGGRVHRVMGGRAAARGRGPGARPAKAPHGPSRYRVLGLDQSCRRSRCDLLDHDSVRDALDAHRVEAVFHLAALPRWAPPRRHR